MQNILTNDKQTNQPSEKELKPYTTPKLTVHGKVEKLTLQTGPGIPGGGGTGPGGSTVI